MTLVPLYNLLHQENSPFGMPSCIGSEKKPVALDADNSSYMYLIHLLKNPNIKYLNFKLFCFDSDILYGQ